MLVGISAGKRLQGRTRCAGRAATSVLRVDAVKIPTGAKCEASLSAFTKLDPWTKPAARGQVCQLGRLAPSTGEVAHPVAGAADLEVGAGRVASGSSSVEFARGNGRGRVVMARTLHFLVPP